jgi:hypothetical protein
MNNVCILFRNTWHHNQELETKEEFEISQKYFHTVEFRTQVPDNSLVIGRYSVLPFFEELEKELVTKRCRLINSYQQHRYVADITRYYDDIKEYTPKTYTNWGNLGEGKWVVKGRTNSRKHRWNTHMFANGREALMRVIANLHDDFMIADQGVVVREFVPLKKLDESINGLPICKEWRCFFYKEILLAHGFYWSNFEDINPGDLPPDGIEYVKKVATIISKNTNFFVIDVAEKEDGGYVVVECNTGEQSGLSCVDPNELYENLSKMIIF